MGHLQKIINISELQWGRLSCSIDKVYINKGVSHFQRNAGSFFFKDLTGWSLLYFHPEAFLILKDDGIASPVLINWVYKGDEEEDRLALRTRLDIQSKSKGRRLQSSSLYSLFLSIVAICIGICIATIYSQPLYRAYARKLCITPQVPENRT